VSFDVLAAGEKSMVARMNYKAGNHVPFHSHPNEQTGYVISGKIRMKNESRGKASASLYLPVKGI